MDENKTNETQKKVWTEAERLELAAQLDQQLDDYIDNLDKKSYSDGWPEDRWQEEMEKHPFFMTKLPENSSDVSPLIEGLQQLKYGEEYNTPNELAQSYKEDGNFNYKHKKYRLAVLSFSKGIASKCEDKDLLAQLYNNRALAQLKLENYRSGFNDCKQALKLKPDYLKSLLTAAKCCFNIKDYDLCLNYCDQVLNAQSKDDSVVNEIVNLRAKAVKNKKLLLRDSRVKEINEKKVDKVKEKIVETIRNRKINIDDSDLFHDSQCYVHLDDHDLLEWPVIFAYPENNQTDFVQNFNENTVFCDQLQELFEEPPAWDSKKRYCVNNLNIYFEGSDGKLHKVDIYKSLGLILQNKNMLIKNGTPWFFVLVANSKEESSFLEGYR